MNPSPPTGDIFGSVGSEGLKVAGVVGLVFFAPMLFVMAALGGSPGHRRSLRPPPRQSPRSRPSTSW